MIEMSPEIGELAKALAAAQGVMPPAKKSKTNPFHKNKYADLTDVWDAAKGPLSANGLSVTQLPASEAGYLILSTMLMHSSGQWIRNTFKIKSKADTAQDMGGALTYARRYAFAAIIGNSSDEDDDGNAANGYTAQPKQKAPEIYEGLPAQKTILKSIFDSLSITDKEVMSDLSNSLIGRPMGELKDIIVDIMETK